MRKLKSCITLGCLVLAVALAQGPARKPGLYEVTITTTHRPRLPRVSSRATPGLPHQDMIDKYGAIVPDYLSDICQLANVVKEARRNDRRHRLLWPRDRQCVDRSRLE